MHGERGSAKVWLSDWPRVNSRRFMVGVGVLCLAVDLVFGAGNVVRVFVVRVWEGPL